MSKLTRSLILYFERLYKGRERVGTNLPVDHVYFIELSEILSKRDIDLVFDPALEKYSDNLNVFFSVKGLLDSRLVAVLNSVYRALLSLDYMRGKE